uniref:Uncharacterized protein n=1 Tax=Arundo donax TaxID=35708 RepID=A0A0A9CU60_ARUDO
MSYNTLLYHIRQAKNNFYYADSCFITKGNRLKKIYMPLHH